MQGYREHGVGNGAPRRGAPRRSAAVYSVASCLACILAGALSLLSAPAQAALVHPFTSRLTERPGEPFSGVLCGVNIDPASGEVYVADPGALVKEEEKPAIDVFSSVGTFVGKIDKGAGLEFRLHEACSTAVNDTNHRIYVANDGEFGEPIEESEREVVFVYTLVEGKYKFEKKLTIDGSGTPQKTFEAPAEEPEAGGSLHVAVDNSTDPADLSKDDVYVAVAEQGVIDAFDAAGVYLKQIKPQLEGRPQNLATDSSGNLFAVVERTEGARVVDVIDEFNPAGVLLKEITGSSSAGFGHLDGVAVDTAGHVYASDGEKLVVDEYDAAGAFMGRITGAGTPEGSFAEPTGVAVNAAGDVYVADRTLGRRPASPGAVVDIFAPAIVGATPFLESEWASEVTSTGATLNAAIDPTGLDTKYRFEYGAEGQPLTIPPEADLGSGESIQHVEARLQNLVPGTNYRFRVTVDVEGHGSEAGALKTFTTLPEGVEPGLPDGRGWELVSPPNKHGALIKGIGGFGVVQAAADGSGIGYAATSPVETNAEANVGAAPVLSVRHTGAGWSSKQIAPPDYQPVGAEGIGSFGLENQVFSSDLSRSLVDPFRLLPLLSPEASERTPYLRNFNIEPCLIEEPTCFVPLVIGQGAFANVNLKKGEEVKFGGEASGSGSLFGPVRVVAATPDLSHVVLRSPPLRTEFNGKPLEASELYEWTEGKPPAQQLRLVSVLPSGEAASNFEAPRLGMEIAGQQDVRNSISSSGSRIFWHAEHQGERKNQKHLYVRDTAKEETIRLDTPEEGVTPEGQSNPYFQTANTAGSLVFFTDEQRLTKDATASPGGPDLYACRLTPEDGQAGKLACKLTDITGTGVVKNPGESAFVQGSVLAASEDGSSVYFVADGVLSNAENAQGEKAAPGTCGERPPFGALCNLYVEHFNRESEAWEEPTFIAALSADDGPDWGATATESAAGRNGLGANIRLDRLTARVSPNGEYAAFMSDRRLTGFDNSDASKASGGTPDEEVFLYSAPTNTVVCASCNRFGQRPHGVFDTPEELVVDRQHIWTGRWLAASVPGWLEFDGHTAALHQPRYLSNSGRLFFNSPDALVPADTNNTADVYQYEPNGVGSCASASGCVALISSGKSQEESAFLDASEDSGDVFFLTLAQLTSQDTDQSYDVYDAHLCTGASPCFVPPSPRASCESATSCQGVSSQPTGFSPPASATFSGPGNLVPGAATQGSAGTKTIALTRAQKLAKALKACRKLKHKKQRAACEKRARTAFGPKKAKKGRKAATRSRGARR